MWDDKMTMMGSIHNGMNVAIIIIIIITIIAITIIAITVILIITITIIASHIFPLYRGQSTMGCLRCGSTPPS